MVPLLQHNQMEQAVALFNSSAMQRIGADATQALDEVAQQLDTQARQTMLQAQQQGRDGLALSYLWRAARLQVVMGLDESNKPSGKRIAGLRLDALDPVFQSFDSFFGWGHWLGGCSRWCSD